MEDIISVGLRPCIVTHKVKGKTVEKKAIFHEWDVSMVSKGDDVIVQTLALVEYEDGTVAQVKIKNIRFIDNRFRGMFWAYFSEVEGGKIDESVTDKEISD